MSCQQVPTAPALKPYPRSVQVGEFEVAISGGVWVAIRVQELADRLTLALVVLRTQELAVLALPASVVLDSVV